ncbi:MAG: LysM domain-containing protein [Planctomycetia bacterium]|nr:LysM domain-containing protein [Planctomycetia bacterium]
MSKVQKISLFLFTLLLAVAAFIAPERLWNAAGTHDEGLDKVSKDLEIPMKPENLPELVVVERPLEESTASNAESTATTALVGAYPESVVLKDTVPPATSPAATEMEDYYDFGADASPMVPNGSRSTTRRIGERGDDWIPADPGINGRALSGPRTHIIMDGDTLESLARRYLHDPARANEIYEFNKDRLHSPQELSIGTRITLPEM